MNNAAVISSQAYESIKKPDAEMQIDGCKVRLFFSSAPNLQVVSAAKQILIQSVADRRNS